MTPAPCPYLSGECDEKQLWKKCLAASMESVDCQNLSDHDLAFVRAAVMGRAVGGDEA